MLENFYTICEKSALGNVWIARKNPYELLETLRTNYGLSFLAANIAASREIPLDELTTFLNPSLKNAWIDPALLPDMQKAMEIMQKIVQNCGKIGILGDYDVDGISSCALLKETFDELGIETKIWLPKREDGYGPSAKALEFFRKNPVEVLILADCGSSAHEFASFYENPLIIIDHHSIDTMIDGKIVINPHRPDVNPLEQCEFQKLCATGLAFLFVHQLLEKLSIEIPRRQKILTNSLDLVALATICDVMEISKLNRALIKKGLNMVEKQERLGLRFLIQRCDLKLPLSASDIAFYVGPRLNAAGRIDDPLLAFDLLTTKDENTAATLAQKLEELNNARKNIQQEAYEEAANLADPEANIICIASLKWHAGIVGIIAAKIQEQFKKPAIIGAIEQTFSASLKESLPISQESSQEKTMNFSQTLSSQNPPKWPQTEEQIGLDLEQNYENSEEKNFNEIPVKTDEKTLEEFAKGFVVKASARSQNAHIGHIIQKAILEKIIPIGGGHAAAGGLTCSLKEWEMFKIWIQKNVILQDEKQTFKIDSVIDLDQITDDFRHFGPHGQGNEEIIILSKNLKILKLTKYERSTRISISQNYKNYTFFVQNHKTNLIAALKKAYETDSFCDVIMRLNPKGYHGIEDLYFEFQ